MGHIIARRLLEQGEHVRVLDIWDSPDRPSEVEFFNCNILDRDGVAKAMRDVAVVHHNAALIAMSKSTSMMDKVNRYGSRVIAEEAVRSGVGAFINMSTTAVYGRPEGIIMKDTPVSPVDTYGRTKFESERETQSVCGRVKMLHIVIRPCPILCNGRLGIYQMLFEWIRESRKIYILGKGGNRIQFVHAHDLIDFYMLVLQEQKSGVYNVGAKDYGTLREDLTNLIARIGSRSRVVGIPVAPAVAALRVLYWLGLSPVTPWHYRTYHVDFHFDINKLLDTGWCPRYSNLDMLFESYSWYEQNRDRLLADKISSSHRKPVREGVLSLLRRIS